ncbi:MAG: imidazole glycerol phosphate synthase, glutamine amidotransferase subunit [Rhodospirillales bacterium RIFCSPLOWO2_12_FULL_58_28]|nr:MAG: imidazole glycerol phosphate synthase, glutamine amidotransferase subunit [Rhodospirillales bacterium RIFCSPLOWO2_02_FULL_58_16]OHC79530.1 MAG: imidazole glycerol phosphate synthase, glutamine amidotransferase subunit [Rhodospirillales bacterium RIFCSPLOWO2_12_FULL_58_28]
MIKIKKPKIAIVDYGLGNLFSIGQACEHSGMSVTVTSRSDEMREADAILLPGVGAFADAMAALANLDLIRPLKDLAGEGKPLIGICLGLQLLMSKSYEFGTHDGLDLIKGEVRRLPTDAVAPKSSSKVRLKIPQVGWNKIHRPSGVSWDKTVFQNIDDGAYMYFVHSYNVVPQDPEVIFSLSGFGDHVFCSSVKQGNIFACQFHPERSASQGLRMYQNIAGLLLENRLK